MESNEEQNKKYNLDDDTSSYSPEIEEDSNNEEEQETSNKKQTEDSQEQEESPEENKENKPTSLIDKILNWQSQLDANPKYKSSGNVHFSPSKKNNSSSKNKEIIDLEENNDKESDSEDNSFQNNKQKKNNQNQKLNNSQINDNNNKNNTKEKGCELFIGNLNVTTEKEDLNKLFKLYGEIVDIRIHKNEKNKKCYAFVRYPNKECANKALELDGTQLNGRQIKVTKSNENATIFIGNIRKTWTQEELEIKIRRIFHNINKIEFFTDPINPNKNRGFCFGIFNTRNEAIKALNYVNKKGGIIIDGISITCDWADVVDDDDNSKSTQIFISNIKEDVQENDLKNYFGKFAKVDNVIMSKNHINSKRKDLVFITFETHENAVYAIKQFEEDKNSKDPEKINELKKIFLLNNNENVSSIQVSLAFSQEAIQSKKKSKDSRKKTTSGQQQNFNSGNNNGNVTNQKRDNQNNMNQKGNKSFFGNNLGNQNDYKNNNNYRHRNKNFHKNEHSNNNYNNNMIPNLNNNKNVQDLLSALSGNKQNFQGNNIQSGENSNLLNKLNQLFMNSMDNNMNNLNNLNNFSNNQNMNIKNNNANKTNLDANNNLFVLSNYLLNICQQNPALLQQMSSLNNIYNSNNSKNNNDKMNDINREAKFLNRKRNINNNSGNNNNNETQNKNFLNINQNHNNMNQNLISQFSYLQNIPNVSPINNSNVSNIPNFQNIIPSIQTNPNFNSFQK